MLVALGGGWEGFANDLQAQNRTGITGGECMCGHYGLWDGVVQDYGGVEGRKREFHWCWRIEMYAYLENEACLAWIHTTFE